MYRNSTAVQNLHIFDASPSPTSPSDQTCPFQKPSKVEAYDVKIVAFTESFRGLYGVVSSPDLGWIDFRDDNV
jgi:hypothetical protein